MNKKNLKNKVSFLLHETKILYFKIYITIFHEKPFSPSTFISSPPPLPQRRTTLTFDSHLPLPPQRSMSYIDWDRFYNSREGGGVKMRVIILKDLQHILCDFLQKLSGGRHWFRRYDIYSRNKTLFSKLFFVHNFLTKEKRLLKLVESHSELWFW